MVKKKSPWDNSNDDDNNPWQPNRDGQDPQDIEALLRKSQDKVRYIMNGGRNKGGFGKKGFWGIAVVVLLLWL